MFAAQTTVVQENRFNTLVEKSLDLIFTQPTEPYNPKTPPALAPARNASSFFSFFRLFFCCLLRQASRRKWPRPTYLFALLPGPNKNTDQ
jgi:hypothetical protein